MENRYPHIFSPLTIGRTVFKNRIWAAPAGAHLLQAQEPYPTAATVAYYREKARGGSANITVSAQNMDLLAPPDPVHLAWDVFRPEYHRYWRRLTDAIHFFGAGASLELLAFTHHGHDAGGRLVAWSVNGEDGPMMPAAAIERVAESYAAAAENALLCGFDMVLVHGGHGLMLSRFLSPLYNQRTDEFGGGFANRTRFAVLILDRIRERVGNRLLVEFRISGDELAGPDGWRIADTIRFVKLVQDRIDVIHVSAGSLMNGTENVTHPTGYLPPAPNSYLAAAVKADPDVKIPVLTLGAFQDPQLIEDTLAAGGADLVAMARGTIADARLVQKAREDRADEIIPCLKCLHCLDYTRAPEFTCSVNPTVGRESVLPGLIEPVGQRKKVVVVGGGPAGMAAAIYARQRGHDVTILERGPRLGGKLVCAASAAFKYDLRRFLGYQVHMVEKLGIEVRLGIEATPADVRALGADAVLAALGAEAVIPPIPGVDGPNVITAEDSYAKPVADSVVVVGGGEVGCETALYLAQAGKNVTVLEMQRSLAPDAFPITGGVLVDLVRKAAVCHVGARCTAIDAEGVAFTGESGGERRVAAGTVVVAAGLVPRAAEAFRTAAPVFWNIGDSLMAGNVRTSLRTAFDAAMQI